MSKQQKNLSLSQIKKKNVETYKDKKRIHFEDGTLDIDVVFKPSKVDELIKELLLCIQDFVKDKESNKIDESVGLVLTMALIVKHFSSLETNASSVVELVELNRELKNREYYDKIVESFDQNEIEKAFLKVTESLTLINQRMALDEAQEILEATSEKAEDNGE